MNLGSILRGAIGDVAPTVAGALGGPLAGRVVREVSNVLTGRSDTPGEDLVEAVRDLKPDQVAALQSLEAEYTARLEIAAADRENARRLAAETGSRAPYWLTAATAAGFFGMLILLCFVEPPSGSESIVFGGTGTLGGAFLACVNFIVGSTFDSRRKTGMLAIRSR